MANEELQSFTDRLDQLFIRRSMKESSYLESLGEQLEDSLERATGNIGDAVSHIEEAVRRGVEGRGGVSVEGMSPPETDVGIQQDVVTEKMIEAAQTFEMAAEQKQGMGEESSIPTEVSFSEDTRENIDNIISEEVSGSAESAFRETENFFGGFTERVFDYIEGLSAQYGNQQNKERGGALQNVLEPLQSSIPDQSQNLGTAQVGEVQRVVDEINSSFAELASSSDVTEKQTEQVRQTFQSLSGEISKIQEQVVEEQMTIEQASEKIKDVTGEIQGQFETAFDGGLENEEEIIREMKNLSGKFSENMKEAVIQAQQMDDIDAGGISEIAIAVQQFTSEDLNVPFAGINENIKSAKEKAGNFIDIFVEKGRPAITAMNVGLGTTLASLAAGIDLFEDARDAAQSLREETGIGRQRMQEMRREANRLRPELAESGLNAQALADVQTTLIDRFGSAQTATAVMGRNLDNIRKSSAQISDSFGISAEKATENLASFEQLSRFVGGSAGSAITLTEQLARANDVAPQAVMEQIAGNAEELAKYAGQSVERLASTATEAQRLGVNLGKVTNFQEQALFNITDQIEKTQKANLLLDARIDSVRLLEASYEGTGSTLDEIQRQVEGINFENIDPFQAQSLENVFGMSVNQLERIKEGAQTLKGMEETTSNLSSAVASGDLTLRQALASGKDRDAITRLTRQLNGLYVVFAKEVAPVISDLVENILPGLTATLDLLTPLVRGLGMGVRFALSPLQSLASLLSGDLEGAVEALVSPFKELGEMFGMTSEKSKKAEESIGLLEGAVVSLGAAIGAKFAIGGIAKLASYLPTIVGYIPGISKLGGAFIGLSNILGVSTGGLGYIVAGLAAAIGGAVYAFYNWEETVQFVKDTFNSFANELFGVQNATEVVSNAFSYLGDAIAQSSVFQSAVGGILLFKKGISSLIDLAGPAYESVSNLISGFYKGKNAAQSFGSTLAYLAESAASYFFPFLMGLDDLVKAFGDVAEEGSEMISALFQGDFSSFGYNLLQMFSDLGYRLIDVFIPDDITSYLFTKLDNFLSPALDFFPQSPPKRGPLKNLVGAGEALIDMIFDVPGYAAEMASNLVFNLFDGLTTAIKSGVAKAQRVFYETIDFVGTFIDKFQSTKGSLLDKLEGTGRMILKKVLPESADIDAAINKFMESFSVITNITDSFTPFDEAYNYITRLIGGLQDIGTAITDGSFSQIDDILFDMIGDLGYNLVDMIFPDALTEYVANKMKSLTGTIRSYLPFSPAEIGPLSTLDEVDIGAEVAASIDTQKVQSAMEEMGSTVKSVAKTVLPDPVVESASDVVSSVYNTFTGGEGEAAPQQQAAQETAATMTAQTVTIQTDAIRAQAEAGQFAQPQVRQEAGAMGVEEDLAGRSDESQVNVQPSARQQPEMNVQPAQEGVATIDQQTVQTETRTTEPEQEIRVDSDTTSMEDLLRQIRNSQQQLLSELQNGNIAVYLDGRKVNKEMLRNLNVVE